MEKSQQMEKAQQMGEARKMDYAQARAFYHRVEGLGSVLGLESIKELMRELSQPWKGLRIVHIAGTNGKGSLSCFLAAILREANIKTGQFTSPAVFDDLETIQADGIPIGKQEYAAHMQKIADACENLRKQGFAHPTVFEIETALAFLHFKQEHCEIVLLETGMGGKTDATNIIEAPLCCVFVSINMDHMQFLGDTIEKITEIKSGIIKRNCPVVSVSQEPAAERILRMRAAAAEAHFCQVKKPDECVILPEGSHYEYPGFGHVEVSMSGAYQPENSAGAIETALLLREMGYPLSDDHIRRGIKNAFWPGRFEKINDCPLFYIDGAHNAAAAVKLRQTLEYSHSHRKILYIMGVMQDKEVKSILKKLLPFANSVYAVTPNNKRALPASKLAEMIHKMGRPAKAYNTVEDAVKSAYKAAIEDKSQDTMILSFGSLYYLKEVKRALHEINNS